MGLNAKKVAGGDFKAIPPMDPGAYPARLFGVIDLGIQPQQAYKGAEKPPRQTMQLIYQFLDEFMFDDDGNEMKDKPRQQFETFALHNLESDLAKSTKRYLALDPDQKEEGEWVKLIGTPCLVNINQSEGKGSNKGRIYNNVTTVTGMRAKDADKAPDIIGKPIVFLIDDWDDEVFETLPAYIKETIQKRLDVDEDKSEEDDWTK